MEHGRIACSVHDTYTTPKCYSNDKDLMRSIVAVIKTCLHIVPHTGAISITQPSELFAPPLLLKGGTRMDSNSEPRNDWSAVKCPFEWCLYKKIRGHPTSRTRQVLCTLQMVWDGRYRVHQYAGAYMMEIQVETKSHLLQFHMHPKLA